MIPNNLHITGCVAVSSNGIQVQVAPGEPLPFSVIHKEHLSSVETVLIRYANLKGVQKAPTLAQKLARDAIFGDNVMVQCTPYGTGTLYALPVRELQYLKEIMFQQFSQYWNNAVCIGRDGCKCCH